MTAEIRTEPFQVVLYGASKHHEPPACYGDDIRTLLDRVWPVLKQHNIPNRGLNHVIYSQGDEVFAGVEAEVADAQALGLEKREVQLDQYAYSKHIGPYRLLGSACTELREWIDSQGRRAALPLIERYGHWTDDESKLETELIQAIE